MLTEHTTEQPVLAYWFCAGDTLPYGDGRPIVAGESHSVAGEIVLCGNGLHASEHPFDVLKYTPGPYLWRVECSGEIKCRGDKLVCSTRKYLKRIDATALCREFARKQALAVIDKWDAPAVVRQYLETGDETIREAAREAAARSAAIAARQRLALAVRSAWEVAEAAAREVTVLATAAAVAAEAAEAAAGAEAATIAAWLVVRAASPPARLVARQMFLEMVETAFAMENSES